MISHNYFLSAFPVGNYPAEFNPPYNVPERSSDSFVSICDKVKLQTFHRIPRMERWNIFGFNGFARIWAWKCDLYDSDGAEDGVASMGPRPFGRGNAAGG